DPVSPATDHALIERRMACRADHKKVGANLGHELHNHPHRMATSHMGLELNPLRGSKMPGAFHDRVEAPGCYSFCLPHLLDEFRHWWNLFHANKMERCAVSLGHPDGERPRAEGGLRSVIRMQDGREHRSSPDYSACA